MTLCIAEKAGQTITFAADSRIGLGDEGHVDIGVKILTVPVVVRSPSNGAGYSSELYNHTLGLGIVGSALNSYLVKRLLSRICGFGRGGWWCFAGVFEAFQGNRNGSRIRRQKKRP